MTKGGNFPVPSEARAAEPEECVRVGQNTMKSIGGKVYAQQGKMVLFGESSHVIFRYIGSVPGTEGSGYQARLSRSGRSSQWTDAH